MEATLAGLATKLTDAAMTIMMRTRPLETGTASRDELEYASAAMRVKSDSAAERLLDNAHVAPRVAEAAFTAAAIEIAQAGMATLCSPHTSTTPGKFEVGDMVAILPEFQDVGDADLQWVVVGEEEKGRVDIAPLGTWLPIPPTSTVKAEWLKRILPTEQTSCPD